MTDSNGDILATYGDAIYCIDVSDPQSPGLVDVWDLGSLDGILDITARGSSFYRVFGYGDELRKLSLNPEGLDGGAHLLDPQSTRRHLPQ